MDRKGPHRRAFFYSPGWTRTNNPPVNSRMLCQLSYRGSLGRKSLAKLGLDLAERVVDLGEHALELDRAGEVVAGEVRQLAPDETLLEPEKELARDVAVEVLLLGERTQLRACEDEVRLVHRRGPDEVRAHA